MSHTTPTEVTKSIPFIRGNETGHELGAPMIDFGYPRSILGTQDRLWGTQKSILGTQDRFWVPKIDLGYRRSILGTQNRCWVPKIDSGHPIFILGTPKIDFGSCIIGASTEVTKSTFPLLELHAVNRSWVPKIDFGIPKSILGAQA